MVSFGLCKKIKLKKYYMETDKLQKLINNTYKDNFG